MNKELEILELIKNCTKPKLVIIYGIVYLIFTVKSQQLYFSIPSEKYNLFKEWLDSE